MLQFYMCLCVYLPFISRDLSFPQTGTGHTPVYWLIMQTTTNSRYSRLKGFIQGHVPPRVFDGLLYRNQPQQNYNTLKKSNGSHCVLY